MAQQRQQRLESRAEAGGYGPDEYYGDDDYDEYADWGDAGGSFGAAGRKASRSSVAVTPGRRPVRHSGLGSSQVQTAAHSRRKRG